MIIFLLIIILIIISLFIIIDFIIDSFSGLVGILAQLSKVQNLHCKMYLYKFQYFKEDFWCHGLVRHQACFSTTALEMPTDQRKQNNACDKLMLVKKTCSPQHYLFLTTSGALLTNYDLQTPKPGSYDKVLTSCFLIVSDDKLVLYYGLEIMCKIYFFLSKLTFFV